MKKTAIIIIAMLSLSACDMQPSNLEHGIGFISKAVCVKHPKALVLQDTNGWGTFYLCSECKKENSNK